MKLSLAALLPIASLLIGAQAIGTGIDAGKVAQTLDKRHICNPYTSCSDSEWCQCKLDDGTPWTGVGCTTDGTAVCMQKRGDELLECACMNVLGNWCASKERSCETQWPQ